VKLKSLRSRHGHGLELECARELPDFQGKVLDEYDRLVDEFGPSVVNAVGSITDQQRVFRRLVSQELEVKHQNEVIDEPA
jgi:hypothetical protein